MKPDRYDPIAGALKEDIGTGDITAEFFVPDSLHASGRIVVREKAIVPGSGAAAEVFPTFGPSIDVPILLADRTEVAPGDAIIEGPRFAPHIISAARLSLNTFHPCLLL